MAIGSILVLLSDSQNLLVKTRDTAKISELLLNFQAVARIDWISNYLRKMSHDTCKIFHTQLKFSGPVKFELCKHFHTHNSKFALKFEL